MKKILFISLIAFACTNDRNSQKESKPQTAAELNFEQMQRATWRGLNNGISYIILENAGEEKTDSFDYVFSGIVEGEHKMA